MRDYFNEHDDVCAPCRASGTALWCEWCCTFTCVHHSNGMWGDAVERGPNGEQLVHRCNDCETELSDVVSVAIGHSGGMGK